MGNSLQHEHDVNIMQHLLLMNFRTNETQYHHLFLTTMTMMLLSLVLVLGLVTKVTWMSLWMTTTQMMMRGYKMLRLLIIRDLILIVK